MPNTIEDRLAGLLTLSKPELVQLWKEQFQSNPADRLRQDIMVSILSYRLQEREHGGLSANAQQRLQSLAQTLNRNPKFDPAQATFKPGTRLVRQWHDKVHVVEVEQRGFKYNGILYESLSEIARQITGTRWSGPVFFGIRGRQVANNKEAA